MTNPHTLDAIQRDFIPYAHCGSFGLNNFRVLNANGKMLANHDLYPGEAMKAGLVEWAKLPEAERQPRAASGIPKVMEYPKPPDPPKNGLILRSHVRALQRDEGGRLSQTGPLAAGSGGYELRAEPELDHVWITESEWKSMSPANPSVGLDFEMPNRIAQRIAMFHMLDKGVGCNNFVWEKASAKLTLKVIEVTEPRIKMGLSGHGFIGKDGNYPIRYQGIVEVNRQKGEISRFEMIALGPDAGDMRTDDERFARSNFWYRLNPRCKVVMAIAFEKISGDKAIDRVPPYAIMFDSAKTVNKPYFQPE